MTCRLLAIAAPGLIGSTWRLWTGDSTFPQIPLFGWAGRLPRWCDTIALGVGAASLIGMLVARFGARISRAALVSFAAATAALTVLNQHRLQPWAYELVVMAIVLGIASPARAALWLRWLVVSIYFHSALSKLDHSFLHTHGQYLAEGLLNALGGTLRPWPEAARVYAALLLPAGELAAAVGLCTRRWRRAALAAALSMHALLVLALGPWGLRHEAAVLVWNVFSAALALVLFEPLLAGKLAGPVFRGNSAELAACEGKTPCRRLSALDRAAGGLVAAVVLSPLLEPLGWFDHWPAWALYASRPERVRVSVHERQRKHLPGEIRQHVAKPPFAEPWCRVRIDRWSLAAVSAPITPEVRFQLGVALVISEHCRDGRDVRVDLESAAHRWTGARSARRLLGAAEIRAELQRCRLNGFPRRTGR